MLENQFQMNGILACHVQPETADSGGRCVPALAILAASAEQTKRESGLKRGGGQRKLPASRVPTLINIPNAQLSSSPSSRTHVLLFCVCPPPLGLVDSSPFLNSLRFASGVHAFSQLRLPLLYCHTPPLFLSHWYLLGNLTFAHLPLGGLQF